MTRRLVACATLSVLCAVPVVPHAADEVPALPDAEFLEYLGSWDGDDEDWLVAASPTAAAPVDASRPAKTIESGGDGETPPPREQKR